MHLLQQPKLLAKMALARLGDRVALLAEQLMTPMAEIYQCDPAKAEDLLSRQLDITRSYLLRNVPNEYYNALVAEVVRALNNLFYKVYKCKDPNKRNYQWVVWSRMIEILFTNRLTKVSLDKASWSKFQDSFYSQAHMLTGLIHLNLQCDSSEADIMRMLKELKSLKYVNLSRICTMDILKCLVQNCKLIQKMNVSHTKLGDECIDLLIQFRYLMSIELNDTAVSESGIEKLLMSKRNIDYIGINCWQNYAHILDHIDSFPGNATKRFSLKCYDNDETTTTEQLQRVFRMCPHIQKVCFTNNETSQTYLKTLHDADHLRQLELVGYDFYADQVEQLLQKKGRDLVFLHFEDITNLDMHALLSICIMCPNLEELILYDCLFVQEIYRPDPVYLKNGYQLFRRMQRFTLRGRESPPTDEQLLFLLSNFPCIEEIYIGACGVSNNVMWNVLDKNPLVCLKTLKVCQNEMSEIIIDRILRIGYSRPEVILTGI